MSQLIIQIGIPLALIILGLITGTIIEKNHRKNLRKRQAQLGDITLCNLKNFSAYIDPKESFLVTGSVCIATDYFKTFIAGLKNLFGGEMRSLESLLIRCRQEATMRMLEEAKENGANSVWNVRFETATVAGKGNKRRCAGVEIIAYATALKH